MQSMANMPAWKEGSGSGSEGEDEVADATSGSDSDSDEDKAFQVRGGLLLVLFYFILFYFILFYFILFYFILFILSYCSYHSPFSLSHTPQASGFVQPGNTSIENALVNATAKQTKAQQTKAQKVSLDGPNSTTLNACRTAVRSQPQSYLITPQFRLRPNHFEYPISNQPTERE